MFGAVDAVFAVRGGTDGLGLAVLVCGGADGDADFVTTKGLTGEGVLDLGAEEGEGLTLPGFCGVHEGDDELIFAPTEAGSGFCAGVKGVEDSI